MHRPFLLTLSVLAVLVSAASRGRADQPPEQPTAASNDRPTATEKRGARRIGTGERPPLPISGRGEGTYKASGNPLWTTVGALAAIAVGLIVVARVWKRHGPAGARPLPAAAIELLGRRPLDNRRSIQLMRVGSRILVVGVSADELRTLTEITDPVEVDYLAGLCRAEGDSSTVAESFRALFNLRGTARETGSADFSADGDSSGRAAEPVHSGSEQPLNPEQVHA